MREALVEGRYLVSRKDGNKRAVFADSKEDAAKDYAKAFNVDEFSVDVFDEFEDGYEEISDAVTQHIGKSDFERMTPEEQKEQQQQLWLFLRGFKSQQYKK